jgi:hypothetical protein
MADPHDGFPQVARWIFDLDGEATFETEKGISSPKKLYVGSTADLAAGRVSRWLPSQEQPALIQTLLPAVPKPNETSAESVVRLAQPPTLGTIRLRSDAPLRFLAVKEGN